MKLTRSRFVATIFTLAAVLWLGASASLWAQDAVPRPDYATWEKQASQIEDLLAEGDPSPEQLQEMRADATKWRARFSDAQGINATRISTLKDQIDALGPAPAEGESEAEDVANRRAQLNDQLAKLQAPAIAATEAYSRADALVKQIDSLERDRQANAIFHLSPSPLLPASLEAAVTDARALSAGLSESISTQLAERATKDALTERAPRIAMFLLAAIVLLTYGRRQVDALPTRLSSHATDDSRAALALLASLGQIAIPMLGIFLVSRAIVATGLSGDWLRPFLLALPFAAAVFFLGRWLARQVFAEQFLAYPTLIMPAVKRRRARRLTLALAAMTALHIWLSRALLPLTGTDLPPVVADRVPLTMSEGGAGLWHLLMIVPAAILLFQMGNILRRMCHYDGSETPPYRARVLGWLGWLVRLIAPISPVLAVLGYVSLANSILWPTILSLGLIGIIILAQDFLADLYQMLRRHEETAREGLVPVLMAFALAVLSLPLFALIWGARVADLAEAWVQIRQGVALGGVRLSPGAVMTFIIVFMLAMMVVRTLQGMMRNTVLPRTKLDEGAQAAAVSGFGYVGVFLAALAAITSAGIDLSSLAIVAGALSVGIGFGLQNIVSNFVSGIILLIERPIAKGDWIEAGGAQGYVTDISVRSTRIKTFDQTDVIVPNSDLVSAPVTNWTKGNKAGRLIVPVGVAYGSDTRKVERILMEIAEDHPIVMINPPPAVLFRGFGASSLDFEIRVILSDVNYIMSVHSDMNHAIAARFAEEEIEIPFPQQDLWLRNPETLRRGPQPEPEAPSISGPADPRTVGATPIDGIPDGEGAGEAE